MNRFLRAVTPLLPNSLPSFGLALFGLGLVPALSAQQVRLQDEDYLEAPSSISQVLESDAFNSPTSLRTLSPDGEHFLVSVSGGMPPLERMARPHVILGEMSIDHRANRSRRLTTGYTLGYELVSAQTGASRKLDIPSRMTVSGGSFSPDGSMIAFLGHSDTATHLYVADTKTGSVRKLTKRALNATMTSSFSWSIDGKSITAVLVPSDRGSMPRRDPVAPEPTVWVGREGETPSRTYRFLLKTPYDKDLLEYLATGQLARIDVADGTVTEIGEPRMISSVSAGPHAEYFRVTSMERPFSYFVPARSFGSREEFWNSAGEVLETMSVRPLRDGSSRPQPQPQQNDGDEKKERKEPKRSLSWRPDGKGMSFLQREPAPAKPAEKKPDAKDGDGKKDGAKKDSGDAKVATASDAAPQRPRGGRRGRRGARAAAASGGQKTASGQTVGMKAEPKKRMDRVMLWKPPYTEDSVEVVWQSETPIQSVRYAEGCERLFVTQQVDGKSTIYAVDLDAPDKKILTWQAEKASGNNQSQARSRFSRGGGGGLMTKRAGYGSVVRQSSDGKYVYRSGTDRPEKGEEGAPRPYLDRYEIGTGKKERMWTSSADVYETLSATLDDDFSMVVLNRQTSTMVPNDYLFVPETGAMTQLTRNVDPAPMVTKAKRERFKVRRVDGFEFWVNVTIPSDHGEKLPALFWFYPREYTSQKQYDDRVRTPNPNSFPRVRSRSMEMFVMEGYVVVQPDCPIVGKEGRMNDNYVGDLRNSLWAVIDELDKRNIIDRDRLAIGGHSYGAFGTANAMIHTPFFKAGIAGDGNYNRTLTPMSFQSERRYLWDARETYFRMSPMLWANQLQGALLMYHGMEDANTGTFPINSPRMFQALDGLNRPVALYQYPYEGHGPIARETIHDLWARWSNWLEIHVKEPGRAKEMYEQPEPELTDITTDPTEPRGGR